MRVPVEAVALHEDGRGPLVKVWPGPVAGEVYAVEVRPGASRGHHLHPGGGEWFVPLAGTAILVVVDPASGERAEVRLQGVRARVDSGLAHALFAVDGPAWVVAVADAESLAAVPFPVVPPRGGAP